jgi:hypothetical protein
MPGSPELVIGDHPNRPAEALQDCFPTPFTAGNYSKIARRIGSARVFGTIPDGIGIDSQNLAVVN